MITLAEFQTALEDGTLRERAIAAVRKDFPHMPKASAEEIVQGSLMSIYKRLRLGELMRTSVETAIMQNVKTDAIDYGRRDLARNKANKAYVKNAPRMFDSTRRIDFKVDLEKSIMEYAKTTDMQKMAILVLYAGFNTTELSLSLNLGKSAESWRKAADRLLTDIRGDMRRKGYRRMRA